MSNPKGPIYWHQGLFLQPEHFQQVNLYNESLLTPFQNYIQPYFWGVCDLDIDIGALKEYNFDLIKGEFLFKDGTWAAINHNAIIEPRSFKGLWERFHEPFVVYVGIKRLNLDGEQVDQLDNVESGINKSRFKINIDNNEVADLYNCKHKAPVSNLNYVLQFIWETEIELYPEYEIIPVCRIEFNGQEAIPSEEFVPSVVNIKYSTVLLNYLKNIKDALYARSLNLGNVKKLIHTENIASILPYFTVSRIVNHYASLLNHHYETPNVSPWTLYGIFRQLLGELSFLGGKVDVLGKNSAGDFLVPSYNHSNLGYCFKQISLLIDEMLDELLSTLETVIHLKMYGSYYKALIPVELLKDSNQFYLGFKSNQITTDWLSNIASTIKIGSQETIEILINRALSGVILEPLNKPPLGVSAKHNINYFRLDIQNMSWESIKSNANICLFWSGVPEGVEIDLCILKKMDGND